MKRESCDKSVIVIESPSQTETPCSSSDGDRFESNDSETSDDDSSQNMQAGDSEEESEEYAHYRSLLGNAFMYLKPGSIFRYVTYLYAERKLLVLFWAHFVSALIIWAHFSFERFDMQKQTVNDDEAFYWVRLLSSSFIYGAKHVTLFEMALIPLTMSRWSIAALSHNRVVSLFLPLNQMTRIHIHLGYAVIFMVTLATLGFIFLFSFLCTHGEEEYCSKLVSEIMMTGYGIAIFCLAIAVTSYYRHSIPYEVFFVMHHLIFVFYALTIAHTLDRQHRSGTLKRSQTFQWFSATFLYYICDRAAMYLNHKYRTRLVHCAALTGNENSRMLIVKLRRPALFQFQPGQLAYLRVCTIDGHWHPFSIASDPSANVLEFYMEVMAADSWTDRLWTMIAQNHDNSGYRLIEFEIMGPYGTPLAQVEDYSHVLAIGTGTGIVPIMSLFKQQVRQLLRLSPTAHFRELEEHMRWVTQVEASEESRRGSMASRMFNACFNGVCRRGRQISYTTLVHNCRTDTLRESIEHSIRRHNEKKESQIQGVSRRELKQTLVDFKSAAFMTTRSIYGVVLLGLLPVLGVALFGLTVSWNTSTVDIPQSWMTLIQAGTVIFQLMFAYVALFIWDANCLLAHVDIAMSIVAPFADWYWFQQYASASGLTPPDITLYCLMTAYMSMRAWYMTVKPRRKSWNRGDSKCVRTMERLDVIWISPSASLVSEIMPEILSSWDELVRVFGIDNATRVCRFRIFVTEKNQQARRLLRRELSGSTLYENGYVQFERPDINRLIENHSIEMISTKRSSYSLLAYVGSTALAREIHECKLFNDMKVSITGNKKHQMDFVSESYGGVRNKKTQVVLLEESVNTDAVHDHDDTYDDDDVTVVTLASRRDFTFASPSK